jgi:hypothetical protein
MISGCSTPEARTADTTEEQLRLTVLEVSGWAKPPEKRMLVCRDGAAIALAVEIGLEEVVRPARSQSAGRL